MDEETLDSITVLKLSLLEEPWGKNQTALEVANLAIQNQLKLLNGTVFTYSDKVDWHHHWKSNDDTNRLYFLSLHYIGQLLSAHERTGKTEYLERAAELLRDFLTQRKTDKRIEHLKDSSEHAYYIRSCVLIKAIQSFGRIDAYPGLAIDAVEALVDHAWWLYDDKHHRDNNHGVMTDFGLIAAAIQLRPMATESAGWIEKGLSRLKVLIKGSFYDDGLNNENTIGYHRLNLNLYTRVNNFVKHYGVGGDFTILADDILAKAEDALRYACWQDGLIPPLGDSAIIPSKVKSINHTKWFKDAKVLFIKDDRLYVSLKCGFSLKSHKHIDETSITIRYDGVDLVVDSGSYNYDYKDPIRQYMVSPRAHSGIYPTWLDKADVTGYCNKYHYDSDITSVQEKDGVVDAICTYSLLNGKVTIERGLHVDLIEPSIRIVDNIRSNRRGEFRQQFIFHPNVKVRPISGSEFEGSSNDVKFRLVNKDAATADLYTGQNGGEVRGWYSPRYGIKEATTGLDLLQKARSCTFITEIKIFT
jgi:hypothetical protein